MATCKRCHAPIAWAYGKRWEPVDPGTLSQAIWNSALGDKGAYIFERRFAHRCVKPPPPPPTPPPVPVVPPTIAEALTTLHCLATAPPAVLKAAYKAMAILNPPDHGWNEEMMKRINNAADTLTKASRM